MNKEQVIAKLREHEVELKAAGIVRLAVFGSVARGDNSPSRTLISWLISIKRNTTHFSRWEELRTAWLTFWVLG